MKRIKRIGTIFGYCFAGLIILLIVFLHLKTFIHTIWVSPSEIETYALIGDEGRQLAIILLQDNKVLFCYQDNQYAELAEAKIAGEECANLAGRLWYVDEPDTSWLGYKYKIYPAGAKPILFEITILDKISAGKGDSVFPRIGESYIDIWLFKANALKFDDMWLYEVDSDPIMIEEMLESLYE